MRKSPLVQLKVQMDSGERQQAGVGESEVKGRKMLRMVGAHSLATGMV